MTGNSIVNDHGDDNNADPNVTPTTKLSFTDHYLGLDDPEVEANNKFQDDARDFNLTDTIAAIISAVLAVVFLIMVVCLIQVIKKRRRERQGNRLNRPIIHTITPPTFGANVGAYRHVPASTTFSWESITDSQAPIPHSESLDESLSASQPSERLSYASTSSATVLVTAILHHHPCSSSTSEAHITNEGYDSSITSVHLANTQQKLAQCKPSSSAYSSTASVPSSSHQANQSSGNSLDFSMEPSTSYG
ncbi:unnamed protein product [Lymnaea stagnalis]|uniref:Uncharacterized protein n=1 Tax=Lymnaea stagnalis TaxID=6523 RepID=A0AAV2HF38_LYMST